MLKSLLKEKLPSKSLKVVHVLSGSIAAYKAPEISDKLRQAGCDVTCVLTAAAKKFVTIDTLRALSGNPVYDDLWSLDSLHDVLHTALAESSDLILVAPASADLLARASAGMANDLATCVLLAATCPILWAPAMNDNMFKSPLTQDNMNRLKKIGHRFIDPIEGHLVCGRTALGHIADLETIVNAVMQTPLRKK